jgi:hypothetical protein
MEVAMRYSFELLNDSVPEPIAAGFFPSEREMKEEAMKYLLDVAREEVRVLPCCLSLVVRDERGGVSSLVLTISDTRAN